MGIFDSAKKTVNEEKIKQKARKAQVVAEKGTFKTRLFRLGLQIFHTLFMFMLYYLIVVLGTILIPSVLAYILGGLGFGGSETQSGAVFIVSMMAGLFLTAWIFVGSFVLVRIIWKKYLSNIRKTLTDTGKIRFDKLFNK